MQPSHMPRQHLLFQWFLALCLILVGQAGAQPFDSAISYQGRLERNGQPVSGLFDFVFNLYDSPTSGTLVDSVSLMDVDVDRGLFSVELAFDAAAAFNGDERWLAITLQPVGSDALTDLEPRQRVAPAPYARYALEAANAGEPWDQSGSTVYYNGGAVGIGTSTPASRLSVAGVIESTAGGFRFPDGSLQTTASTGGGGGGDNLGNHIATQNLFFSQHLLGLTNPTGAQIRTGPLGHTWYVQPGNATPGAHRFGVNPAGADPHTDVAELVVDYLGRVGIGPGRFYPQHRLDVAGNARIGTDAEHVFLGSDGNAFLELRESSTPYIDFTNSTPVSQDFDVRLILTGDDSLTIDGGRVGFGGTMTSPQFKIDLPNQADNEGRGRANQWVEYSTRRAKTSIHTLTNASEQLQRLRGVEFEWNPEHGGGPGLGFIAEEVGAVFPELVTWEENGIDAQALHTTGLLPVVVEALKEQMREIERQRLEIEQLRSFLCTANPEATPCS